MHIVELNISSPDFNTYVVINIVRIRSDPSYVVEIELAPLVESNFKGKYPLLKKRERIIKQIPLALLSTVPLGSIWKNGNLDGMHSDGLKEFKITIPNPSIHHPISIKDTSYFRNSYSVGMAARTVPYASYLSSTDLAVLFCPFELFRIFYCNGGARKHFLAGSIDRYVQPESVSTKNREVTLTLNKTCSNLELNQITNIYTSAYAKHCYRDLYSSILSNDGVLRTAIPSDLPLTMTVLGRLIESKEINQGQSTIQVVQFLSKKENFHFDTIVVHEVKPKMESEETDPNAIPIPHGNLDDDSKLTVDSNLKGTKSGPVQDVFHPFQAKEVNTINYDRVKFGKPKKKENKIITEPFSTEFGSPEYDRHSNAEAANVSFTSTKEEKDESTSFLSAWVAGTCYHLKTSHGFECENIFLSRNPGEKLNPPISRLNNKLYLNLSELSNKSIAILYSPFSLIKISKGAKILYYIEFFGRHVTKSFIIISKTGGQSKHNLLLIIYEVIKNCKTTLSYDQDALNNLGIKIQHLDHQEKIKKPYGVTKRTAQYQHHAKKIAKLSTAF